MRHVLFVGNPNCGKTSIFNQLTGQHEAVGNWSGVTVEKKTAHDRQHHVSITDLPGIYSLTPAHDESALDQNLTVHEVLYGTYDVIVNVIDACHLERHLYLTSQLLERKKPLILVLNMMDLAKKKGIHIDLAKLEKQCGCVVLALPTHHEHDLAPLHHLMQTHQSCSTPLPLPFDAVLSTRLRSLEEACRQQGADASASYYRACRIVEGDESLLLNPLPCPEACDHDLQMADVRYQKIHDICQRVQTKHADAHENRTAMIDRVVLHRWFGIPIFFAVMYVMFMLAMNIGGLFQTFFDLASLAIFMQGTQWLLHLMHAPLWLSDLCVHGIGEGLHTTMTFIPVLAIMYLCLAFLEASGYMARAAFVMDQAMRFLGLPGKAFVPLVIGFGCNVPAVMATRTLDRQKERWLTIMMAPFMSCSARLAIYAVFVATFFPRGGQNVVFSLYLLGILMAVLTGLMLRKTLFQGPVSPLIIELPTYQRPRLKHLLGQMWRRLQSFVVRAGQFIIPVCMLLSVLQTWKISIHTNEAVSLVTLLGQWLTPMFAPMGLSADNWPACVSLITGVLAKEVVIGTLNQLYAPMGSLATTPMVDFNLLAQLKAACLSIPQQLMHARDLLFHPLTSQAAQHQLSIPVTQIMMQKFGSQASAYAYLVFVLLYIPCISTMAVIKQEATRRLMWFSTLWSFVVAYVCAVLCYQCATFVDHPNQTLFWVLGLCVSLIMVAFKINRQGGLPHHVTTNP